MSLEGRLQDHIAAHRATFTEPVQPLLTAGKVLGWQDGGYLVQQGNDVRLKQSVTSGALATGSVVAARGRVDGQRSPVAKPQDAPIFIPQPSRAGLVLWLDIDFYIPTFQARQYFPKTRQFLGQLFDYFLRSGSAERKLYTLPTSDPRLLDGIGDFVSEVAVDYGLTVKRESPLTARGLYFAPLLKGGVSDNNNTEGPLQPNFWSAAELAALKRLAKTHGVICSGEWRGWLAYDNALLRGFGIRDTVKVTRILAGQSQFDGPFHKVKRSRIFPEPPELFFDATGVFEGLREPEILATVEGQPSIAYFPPIALQS
jgi:hypothetical protein